MKVFTFITAYRRFQLIFFVRPQPAGEQLNSAAECRRGKHCGVFKHGNTMYFEKGKREFLTSSEINISKNIIL
jgi:hypothetical protein